MYVIELDESSDLQKYITSNDKVIVDFYADWCRPCKQLTAYMCELMEMDVTTVFVKVNIENLNCYDLMEQYKITAIPRLIFIHKGKTVYDVASFNKQITKTTYDSFMAK